MDSGCKVDVYPLHTTIERVNLPTTAVKLVADTWHVAMARYFASGSHGMGVGRAEVGLYSV